MVMQIAAAAVICLEPLDYCYSHHVDGVVEFSLCYKSISACTAVDSNATENVNFNSQEI